ncbi:MAG TPA: substrate-binding domain-containing protein [Candidatus Sumerlaeota bacterium]|nr:substrate-binding domain-containing protein [Candidatus Sumerlaeota bacterium]
MPLSEQTPFRVIRYATALTCLLMLLTGNATAQNPPQKPPQPTPPPTSATATRTYKMVVFLRGIEFWNWAYAGMHDAARSVGPDIKVELVGPENWDSTREAITISDLAEKRVNGILLTAGNSHTLDPAINKAVEAGIPVVTFDSDAPQSKRLGFIGSNNYSMGLMAGETMAQWLQGLGGAIGVCNNEGTFHLEERLRGFRDGVEKVAPGTVIHVLDDHGDQKASERNFKVLLTTHPEIRGLFGTHGEAGPAAAKAVRDMNLQSKVQILAFDFGKPVLDLIGKGEIRGTVAQNPYLMGYYGFLMMYGASNPQQGATAVPGLYGFSPVPPLIDTGSRILGKDDIEQLKRVPLPE